MPNLNSYSIPATQNCTDDSVAKVNLAMTLGRSIMAVNSKTLIFYDLTILPNLAISDVFGLTGRQVWERYMGLHPLEEK